MRDTPTMATIRARIEYTERNIRELRERTKADKEWLKELEKEAKKKTAATSGNSSTPQRTSSTETRPMSTNVSLRDVLPSIRDISRDD